MKLWDNAGPENTEDTVKIALEKAEKRGIKEIVAASNEGDTIFSLLQAQQDLGIDSLNITCVTHRVGFTGPGEDEMGAEVRNELKSKGVQIFTGTHILGGVDRALRKNYGGAYPPEIIANSLRMLGQGTKVCLEISVMALDAGFIPYDQEIMALGGTGRGADTAAVICPEHSSNIFDSEIIEILCKPEKGS